MVTVADVASWLEQAYPPRLAESWDRVGLACGDPDAEVTDVLFAVDVTDAVVDQARELGARYALPMDNPVGGDGKFLADVEIFAGLHVFAANQRVIEVYLGE